MNSNYLSRNNTDCLKGICAFMVVLCHVCARTGIGAGVGLGPIITAFGYLGVSGFMFMSGFGLTISLLSSDKMGGGVFVQVSNAQGVAGLFAYVCTIDDILHIENDSCHGYAIPF